MRNELIKSGMISQYEEYYKSEVFILEEKYISWTLKGGGAFANIQSQEKTLQVDVIGEKGKKVGDYGLHSVWQECQDGR